MLILGVLVVGAKSWMVAGVHPTASGRIVHSFAASGNETEARYGATLAPSGDPPGNQRKEENRVKGNDAEFITPDTHQRLINAGESPFRIAWSYAAVDIIPTLVED